MTECLLGHGLIARPTAVGLFLQNFYFVLFVLFRRYPNAAENDLAGYPEPQYARPPTPQGSGPLSIAAARPVAVARVKASSPVRVITRPVSQGHHRAGLPVAVARPRVVAQKRPPPGPAPKNAAGHTAVAIGRPPSFNPDCAPSTAASPEKLRASADRNQYRALLLRYVPACSHVCELVGLPLSVGA